MKQFIKSISKKTSTISENGIMGIKAINEGIHNYKNYDEKIENLAKERVKKCIKCKYYKEEESDFLKIDDTLIPDSDQMCCGLCGCSLPYKLRQSVLPCNKWNI